MSVSEYSVIENFNGKRSFPSKFMFDIEYSVITSDVIQSFDCSMITIDDIGHCGVVDKSLTSNTRGRWFDPWLHWSVG